MGLDGGLAVANMAREGGEPLALTISGGAGTDTAIMNAQKMPALEGYMDVIGHSDGYAIQQGGNPLNYIDHTQLATAIQGSTEFQGQGIRLLACDAGKFPNGLAQNLANELGVPVMAPTRELITFSDGTSMVGYYAFPGKRGFISGSWQVFNPR